MYLNKIELIGHLGKSPERKTTKTTGRTFALFSLATQSAWKDANEQYQRKVEWHRLIAWNGLGEYAASKLKKGDHVYVEGVLVSSTYEKEIGKGKNKTKVTLTSWQVKAQSIRKLSIAKAAKPATAAVEPQPSETPF
ncbi:MAG: single-stranded DNA-binding protein [Candidatus Acidiferrales bacterium]